jgi:hypothetical protein
MVRISVCVCAFFLFACCVLPVNAQQPAAASANLAVPSMVNFSGVLTDVNHKPLTGTVGVTFYLYKDSEGGAPLWMETQNVEADKAGHYTAALGSTNNQGLPAAMFASGEARWLGVQIQGQPEQPRVLLMSVPYALKALDAETIGGRPVSSFMLAPSSLGRPGEGSASPPGTITGTGTAGFVPLFTGVTTIGNSKIFQTVGFNVGIGITAPTAKLDVNGTGNVRDTLTLFPKLTHPTLSVHGTAFAVSRTGIVTFVAGQTFPGTGTVTSVGSGAGLTGGPITSSGTLRIKTGGVTNAMLADSSLTVTAKSPLTGGGSVSLGGSTSLGLTSSCSSGQILKWNGSTWACSADNNSGGTVTSVGSGLGLTGGPITSSGTLAINTSVVPQLGAPNAFTNNNAISVNSSSPGLGVSNAGSGDGIDITAGSGTGVNVSNTGIGGVFAGNNVVGILAEAPASGAYGVLGEAAADTSFTPAIFGLQSGNTQITLGVEGFTASPAGAGVYGEAVTGSATASTFTARGGVWGDTGNAGEAALVASGDDDWGLLALTTSPHHPTIFGDNEDASSASSLVLQTFGFHFGGVCNINVSGDLACTGSKSAVVPVDSGTRKVALYAVEAPENWFEDFGSGALSGGVAAIALEPTFVQTVNTDTEYHIFLTPKGDCKGLYVASETAAGFEVRELGAGKSNVRFDYRIVARRKGYENIRLADKTVEFAPPNLHRVNAPAKPRPSPLELVEKYKQMAVKHPVAQPRQSGVKVK